MSVILAFGANLPFRELQPAATILAAMQDLAKNGVQFEQVSRAFQTPCFPKDAGPDFVNAAARVTYDGTISALLALCHGTEARLGRSRRARWSARTLDIDILAAGDMILPDRPTWDAWHTLTPQAQATQAPDQLLLPHPRLAERAFVLIPLADVAAHWTHPILGQTADALKNALPTAEKDAIWPIEWPQGRFDGLPLPTRSPK